MWARIVLWALIAGCGDDDAGGRNGDGGPRGDGGPASDAGPIRDDAGPGVEPDDLSAMLEPIRAGAELPGLAAAVYEGETLLAIGAVGVRALGSMEPVTIGDRWHLGSCTKAMTATLLATYVEGGTLRWDMVLDELFPALAGYIDPGYGGVTLADLLGHRGGLDPEHTWLDPYWGDTRPLDVQRAEVTQALLGAPPVATPGTFSYANSGYVVAASAVEELSGRTWEELMGERIFGPLGMSSCGFGAPGTPGASPPDEPQGHWGTPPTAFAPGDPGSDNPAVLGPAGTVHCTLQDWARFAALHLAGARGEATAILDAPSIMRLHQPWPGGDYSLGWGVVDRAWAGGLALTHSGSNTLWFVVVWIAPADDRFLLVATNIGTDAAATATDDAAAEIVGRYFDRFRACTSSSRR